jgi:receptor protein-tyrosine kinase
MPLEDGLCEVLRTDAELDEAIRPTHAEGLWLLTAGYCDMDAIHAMANDQLQPLFEKLRGMFDFIIVDGAPVLGLPDSLIIGQNCDAAILSVLRDSSQVPKIYQAAEQLKAVGIRLVGAVVNGVRAKTDNRVVRPHLAAPRLRGEATEVVETA